MERVRKAVNAIAYTQHEHLAKLSPLQLSLIPVLFFASSLYKAALSLRRSLYHFGLFRKHRLPVPVISVGNLTWGGNGKTPMTEFIARYLADSGISPLILTRGYAGGDEAKMLHRHFLGRPVKIGVGAKRAAVAAKFFERYGFIDPCSSNCSQKVGSHLSSEKIGAIILDDGMQVLCSYCMLLKIWKTALELAAKSGDCYGQRVNIMGQLSLNPTWTIKGTFECA